MVPGANPDGWPVNSFVETDGNAFFQRMSNQGKKALPSVSTNELTGQPSGVAPGTILQDRYLVVRPLGKGGMGAVYEALDQRLDSTVALKETLSVDNHLRKQF